MRTGRLLCVGTAAVAATACLSACSGSGSSPVRAALRGSTVGGALTIGLTEPGSLDPGDAYDPAGQQMLDAVCEPLLQRDPITAALRDGLASSFVISGSGSDITVRLRTDARYPDGAKLTATDVADELSRVAKVDTASYEAPLLSEVKGYDQIHGITETSNSFDLKQLSGVQALSSNSFSISLTDDDASFIDTLASLVSAPVPNSDDNVTSPDQKPDCIGPYQLATAFKSGTKQITLVRSPRYYGKDEVYTRGGRGYADTIDVKIYPTLADEVRAYQAGKIDIAEVPDNELKAAKQDAGSLVAAPNGSVEYVGLPDVTGTSDIFAMPAVHVALSEAIDRVAIDRAAYGGGSLPAGGFIPPTVGSASATGSCTASTPATGNLAAARATLRRVGVSLSGKPLTFFYNSQFSNAAVARTIAAEWKMAFGLKITLQPMSWPSYLQQADETGFTGAFLESWSSVLATPESYMYPLFDSASAHSNNFGGWTNADFDRTMTRARQASELSGVHYDDLSMQKLLCDAMPMIPIVYRQWHYLVRTSAVGDAIGSWTDASSGLLDLREIYVRRR